MPDGAIISTTSPHENLCLKRTHTILSSTITRIAKNQKIHRIFTLVAFHPDNLGSSGAGGAGHGASGADGAGDATAASPGKFRHEGMTVRHGAGGGW